MHPSAVVISTTAFRPPAEEPAPVVWNEDRAAARSSFTPAGCRRRLKTPASKGWNYEQYLAQVLSEEVASRETHGGAARVKAAHFAQVKTWTTLTSPSSARCAASRSPTFTSSTSSRRPPTSCCSPPGTGKTHPSVALVSRPPA